MLWQAAVVVTALQDRLLVCGLRPTYVHHGAARSCAATHCCICCMMGGCWLSNMVFEAAAVQGRHASCAGAIWHASASVSPLVRCLVIVARLMEGPSLLSVTFTMLWLTKYEVRGFQRCILTPRG